MYGLQVSGSEFCVTRLLKIFILLQAYAFLEHEIGPLITEILLILKKMVLRPVENPLHLDGRQPGRATRCPGCFSRSQRGVQGHSLTLSVAFDADINSEFTSLSGG